MILTQVQSLTLASMDEALEDPKTIRVTLVVSGTARPKPSSTTFSGPSTELLAWVTEYCWK